MALETKPIAKIKTGVWVNKKKLAKILDKISTFYGFYLLFQGVFNIMMKSYTLAVINIGMAIPLLLIMWSHDKWRKQNEGK